MLDTRETYPLDDFVRNPEAHAARLKETHTPQMLTVNGQAEVVLLDTGTYEYLMDQLSHLQAVSALRTHMAQAKKLPRRRNSSPKPRGSAVMRS